MKVLVCGGRDFNKFGVVGHALDVLDDERGITEIIEGGAPGADYCAAHWANSAGVKLSTYPADWIRLGRSAGPTRNAKMLAEGKPDLVVAFPGGIGTADMVRRARAAGVEVIEIKET